MVCVAFTTTVPAVEGATGDCEDAATVGAGEGAMVLGAAVVGWYVGCVGCMVGAKVGLEGFAVGSTVGNQDGSCEGFAVGEFEGIKLGLPVGSKVGLKVGSPGIGVGL